MTTDKNKCHTSKAAFLVVNYVGVIAFVGLLGVIFLIYNNAGEGAVAIVAGMTGVAIGSLSSMLNNTSNPTPPLGTQDNPATVQGTDTPGAPKVKVEEQP